MKSPSSFSAFARLPWILAVVTLAIAPLAASSDVKLLTVGNSFAGDATAYLAHLAKAGGHKLVIGRANIGGCSLERHATLLARAEAGDPEGRAYKNFLDPVTRARRAVSLPEALSAHAWDFVTIQQVSSLSYKPESFHPHADRLIVAIRRHAPSAEILIHQTWAYREDHRFFRRGDGLTQARMHEGLHAAYRRLAADTGFRLLPVGDAFALARRTPRWTYTSDIAFDFKNPPANSLPAQPGSLNVGWRWRNDAKTGEPTFGLDAIHANVAGRYLAACVWYLVLFNADSVPVAYLPAGLSAGDAADLRTHAVAAVNATRTPLAVR